MNKKVNFYTIKPVERGINFLIRVVFYYRIGIVLLGILTIAIIAIGVWNASPPGEKLKGIATILTCGSIVIGIFYSILNYEYNQVRFKRENKTSKDLLSFNVALEFQQPIMTGHYTQSRKFYLEHRNLLLSGDVAAFEKELTKPKNEQACISTICMFNFLEIISMGVLEGIMDEKFIKGLFGSLFKEQYNTYIVYIEYRRREKQKPKIWNHFTTLALRWINGSD